MKAVSVTSLYYSFSDTADSTQNGEYEMSRFLRPTPRCWTVLQVN